VGRKNNFKCLSGFFNKPFKVTPFKKSKVKAVISSNMIALLRLFSARDLKMQWNVICELFEP